MLRNGLDWFRLDVSFSDIFELIVAEFGSAGFEILIRLEQKILREEGYYCIWSSEVILLFAKTISLGVAGRSIVSEVVESALRRGLYDKEKFSKFGILTSAKIQSDFWNGSSRRKRVEIIEKYLVPLNTPLNSNVHIISENVSKKPQNVYISQQSRVEESRGEYIKDANIKEKDILEIAKIKWLEN